MHKSRTLINLFLVAVACVAVLAAGCAAIQERDTGVRIGVQYATMKVIKGEEDRRDRLVEIFGDIRGALTAEPRDGVDAVISAIRGELPLDRMAPEDQALSEALLAELRARLLDRYGDQAADGEVRLAALTVVNWVLEAANRWSPKAALGSRLLYAMVLDKSSTDPRLAVATPAGTTPGGG